MSDAAGDSWAVLLEREAAARVEEATRALARVLGTTLPDAAMAVRRARGILLDGAGRGEAEALAAGLAAEGVVARAVPSSSVQAPPQAFALTRAAPLPDGLHVAPAGESGAVVPWGRVRLLALGPWKETVRGGKVKVEEGPSAGQMALRAGVMLGTGLPIGLGKKKTREVVVEKTEFRILLDVVLRGPAERRRIHAEKFDWSGLGPLMAFAAHANVRAMVGEILRLAPAAGRSPGVDLLLAGGRLASLGFEGPDDFEREERWLLAVLPE